MLYAHVDPEGLRDPQLLVDHLNAVADRASRFSACFGMAAWGRALGLLHDAGKTSAAFQKRLQGSSIHVDHSTAGAKIAMERYAECAGMSGRLMAYALAGHHGGLPNGIAGIEGTSSLRTPLEQRLAKEVEPHDEFSDLVAAGSIELPGFDELGVPSVPDRKTAPANDARARCFAAYVLGRMLYSCLTDADGLDTEQYMAPEAAAVRARRSCASTAQLFEMLQDVLDRMASTATPVNRARQAVLSDCLVAADEEPGLFALTVPTGGGKTLSSLAFALRHAMIYDMDRVIIAIPFTSIVEQTAAVLKGIFGEHNVLEHHSSYDFADLDGDESYAQRLATQNWDAPIIVTTNVQLLESLFSSKPGKSRKVHNTAKSVIILDEAQTLPDALLMPSLAMLEELTLGYGTSIVLCSATQPALELLWPFGSQPREIIEHAESFPEVFGSRVAYEMLGTITGEELVDRVAADHQALCVVGTKRGARWIYDGIVKRAGGDNAQGQNEGEAGEGVFHLSAAMTPAHRRETLDAIRDRLEAGERCIVVSTQLVEAGVDVDFPVVYRELAGMDSIVQAAGRCNREGRREAGHVRVFEYTIDGEPQKTTRWLEAMKDLSRLVVSENDGKIEEHLVRPFFEMRHEIDCLDEGAIFATLSSGNIVRGYLKSIPFECVDARYRIIDDDTVSLFIPRGEEGMARLQELLGSDTPAALASRLQQHSVSVFRWALSEYNAKGALGCCEPFYFLRPERLAEFYREDVGLVKPGEEECQLLFM